MQRKIFLTLTIILLAMMFSITAAAQQQFSVSLSGRQEVPANTSSGRGECIVMLNATETQITVTCNYQNLTSNVMGAHIHDNGPVGVIGAIRFNFNYTGGIIGTIGPLTFDTTPAQVADLRANRWYVNIHTSNFTGGEIRGQIKRATLAYDRDGDGRTDIVVFRQSATSVYTLNSLENNVTTDQLGTGTGDIFINNMGDFDGDGRADPTVLKISANNEMTWVIMQSRSNTLRVERWGSGATDAITPADYDGDGKLDIAVFRRATGIWYIIESLTGNPRYEYWGSPNDFPIIGDYDGDGKADLCVLRNQSGVLFWYIRNSSDGQMQVIQWGAGGDNVFFFFPIDFDGDGKQDIMVNRVLNGQRVYFVRRSSDGQMYALAWGAPNFNPQFGDYDGDGKTDVAARQTIPGGNNGLLRWHIFLSATQTHRAFDFGEQLGQQGSSCCDQRPGEPQVEQTVGIEGVLGIN